MSQYKPPIQISAKILNLIAAISERLKWHAERESKMQLVRLRRNNQILTIQGSLAIEGNYLTVEQITAVLEGKPVIASRRAVQEVKNALAVYARFEQYDPHQEADLLAAHQLLMAGLMDESGRYRCGEIGFMRGAEVIHRAPSANQVPRLMKDLLAWLKRTEYPPLIASALFHYELEFIHPFADGNGRLGRLWQSLILAKWHPPLANLPIESLLFTHQIEYYHAIATSTAQINSAPFVEFMLEIIEQTLREQSAQSLELFERPQSRPETRPESTLAKKIQQTLKEKPLSRSEIARHLGHKSISSALKKQIISLLHQNLIEMTIPDKPTSRLQKYRLTELGCQLLER